MITRLEANFDEGLFKIIVVSEAISDRRKNRPS